MLSAFIKKLDQQRQQWVSEAAYYKAMNRGFGYGGELNDWLVAEQDYLTMLINLQLNVLEEDGRISTMGLRQIAESLGVENPQLLRSEFELIRAIQDASHHRLCFQSQGSTICEETNCHWQENCRKIVAIWHR